MFGFVVDVDVEKRVCNWVFSVLSSFREEEWSCIDEKRNMKRDGERAEKPKRKRERARTMSRVPAFNLCVLL